ncbi:hypothetical protein EJB05_44635, partial [Eragrostis curvula]
PDQRRQRCSHGLVCLRGRTGGAYFVANPATNNLVRLPRHACDHLAYGDPVVVITFEDTYTCCADHRGHDHVVVAFLLGDGICGYESFSSRIHQGFLLHLPTPRRDRGGRDHAREAVDSKHLARLLDEASLLARAASAVVRDSSAHTRRTRILPGRAAPISSPSLRTRRPLRASCPASRRPVPLSCGVVRAAGLRNGSISHFVSFQSQIGHPIWSLCIAPRAPSASASVPVAALPPCHCFLHSFPADARHESSDSRGSKSTAGKHLKEPCSLILSRRWIRPHSPFSTVLSNATPPDSSMQDGLLSSYDGDSPTDFCSSSTRSVRRRLSIRSDGEASASSRLSVPSNGGAVAYPGHKEAPPLNIPPVERAIILNI